MRPKLKVCLIGLVVLSGTWIAAFGSLDEAYTYSPDHPAIQYATTPVNEPAWRLAERLKQGDIKLSYDSATGYLPAILRLLQVPISSQIVVFSKTSLQGAHIFPRNPRAIYFNDNVSVGYIRGAEVIEITSVDPQSGVVFYTLDQERVQKPEILRRGECTQCHLGPMTLGVPGMLVRSVSTDRNGAALFNAATFLTDHRSPLNQRWGGWYVTGTHGSQTHMGNTTVGATNADLHEGRLNLTDLRTKFDTGAYLSPHSDIVALMVLEHQARMTNLITRTNYETRAALYKSKGELNDYVHREIKNAAEELVRYMLFSGEFQIAETIKGTSAFAKEFAAKGPVDHRGRSLRDLDLTRRMFQYPCSYLIYSDAFDALPDAAKQYIYLRLWEVLTGKDRTERFSHLSAVDREAIFEILLDTKPSLPSYWRADGELGTVLSMAN